MKKVFTAPNVIPCDLLKSALEANGISRFVKQRLRSTFFVPPTARKTRVSTTRKTVLHKSRRSLSTVAVTVLIFGYILLPLLANKTEGADRQVALTYTFAAPQVQTVADATRVGA